MVFLRLLTGGTRSKTPSSHNVFLLVFPQRVIYNPCPYICFWFKFTKTFLLAPSYTWPHIVFLKGISKRAKNETFYVFTNLWYAPSWWTCPNKTSHGQLTTSFCKSVYSWLVDSRPKGKYSVFKEHKIISTLVHISCRVLPSLERLALMLWDCCGPGG